MQGLLKNTIHAVNVIATVGLAVFFLSQPAVAGLSDNSGMKASPVTSINSYADKEDPYFKPILDAMQYQKDDGGIKSPAPKDGNVSSPSPQNQLKKPVKGQSEQNQQAVDDSQGNDQYATEAPSAGSLDELWKSMHIDVQVPEPNKGLEKALENMSGEMRGFKPTASDEAMSDVNAKLLENAVKNAPGQNDQQSKSNGGQCQGSKGGSQGEDAKAIQDAVMHLITEDFLINVANENAGTPTASMAPIKTYSQAIWMVQQMYKKCYIPMAVLFLLPGALITNAKTMVSFGVLNAKDEDTQTPFTGIFRAVIAVFLIPATQLFVSYVIDTSNALTDAVRKEVHLELILLWAEEQIQTYTPEQQGKLIKNIPAMARSPLEGKFASMPIKGAIMEQMSYADINMAQIFAEIASLMTEGLSIISAFQVVFMCYLFLLGPLAAAFFAWPSGVGRDLFRKAFGTWMDAVVILALWKFWWNVVLLCMTVRLETAGVNPFDEMECYIYIAFTAMLLFVPFNPFDFKPGEIVSHLLEKAQQTAGKVAQGQGGGGGGSGGGGGGGVPSKGGGGGG